MLSKSRVNVSLYVLFTSGSLLSEILISFCLWRMEMQRLTHAGSLLCFSSCFSHVGVNGACVEATPFTSLSIICHCRHVEAIGGWSIRGDMQLFVYTQSSITARLICTLQGGRRLAANHRVLWRWGWKEIWREEDSKKGSFVNSGVGGWGGHMNAGKLSEEEKNSTSDPESFCRTPSPGIAPRLAHYRFIRKQRLLKISIFDLIDSLCFMYRWFVWH